MGQSAALDPYWTDVSEDADEAKDEVPPKEERTVNWDKIIEHFRRGTLLAANALEDLITQLDEQGWDD